MISPTIHFSLSNYKNTNQSQSIQDIALWIQNRLNVVKDAQNNDTIRMMIEFHMNRVELPISITPKYSWSWPTTVMKVWDLIGSWPVEMEKIHSHKGRVSLCPSELYQSLSVGYGWEWDWYLSIEDLVGCQEWCIS